MFFDKKLSKSSEFYYVEPGLQKPWSWNLITKKNRPEKRLH